MRRNWLVAVVTLHASLFQACTVWRTEPLAPRQAIEQRPLTRARLVQVGGESIVLTGPRIRGDSIAGLIGLEERVVALRDVSAVQTRRVSAGLTVGVAAVGFGLFILVLASSAGSASSTDCIPFGC